MFGLLERVEGDGVAERFELALQASGAVQTILVDGNASTLDAFLAGEDYVQHNPRFADGVSGLLAALKALAAQGITMKYDQITHVVAEGNFAYVRSGCTEMVRDCAHYASPTAPNAGVRRNAGPRVYRHFTPRHAMNILKSEAHPQRSERGPVALRSLAHRARGR